MKTSIIFFSYLSLVLSLDDDTEIKVNYYEKLIKDAINKAKNYNLPKDNSAHFKNVSKDIREFGTFDFIVVGAGTSGSVVASRLSEVEGFNILLLEAGGWDDDLTDIPYPSLILQLSDRNWGYYTVPQKNGCYGWKGRQCAYAAGKLIGGSGSIGQLAYVRGNKADYDNWSSMGNQGWSFEEVLPYFKKLENFDSDDIDLNYRGFAGPVNVEYGNVKEHFEILSEPLIELGLGVGEDYNGRKQIGSFRNQINTKYARRVSGASAYIRPSLTRHNFNVTLRALVTKILINEITRTAHGVEFIQNGQKFIARAKREVILCAGGINTAQLLMLSGIGPIDELLKHSIPIIANLPVGKELKDHYLAFLSYKSSRHYKKIPLRNAILDYLNGTGILGRPTNALGESFVNTRDASSSVPNIEYIYYPPFPICYPLPFQSNFTDEAQEYMKELSHNFNIAVLLLHPKSTGTLKLRSRSMIDFPLIDIGMFEIKKIWKHFTKV
ncbi:hypothetical protein WA026_008661 [Henosepilachna vigintioctopunctata]|uniref:Glucose-methanol-choline oxidoreductase N-terminal domain-containing protein n=1 Tax=Henosepilachna vigintioctopunctata TaxID=420089 RepID=A0AAW1UH32_9CUCU